MPDAQDSADAHDLGATGAALADPPVPGQLAEESVTGAGESVTGAVSAVRPVTVAPEPGAQPPLTAVQLALQAGWTMAVLYGRIQAPPADDVAELPTADELQPAERRELELNRLRYLLRQLAGLPGIEESGLPAEVPASDGDETALKDRLREFNLAILEALAATQPDLQLAYELGRSLRDTASPPLEYAKDQKSPAPALARQLARGRVSELQEWLATLSTQFPQHAAAVVAASLGRWSELAAVTVHTSTARLKRDQSTDIATRMCEYLLPQGDLWLLLLTGARSASGLLSPEGYVAAGEVALRRSAAIVRQVLRHYAVALLIVAAALAGILFLAVSNLDGAAKVWTAIAAISGSLGVSARTVASATSRLAAEAERPVFAMAEEDAMAWAITTMPAVNLTSRGVQQLRKAGIAPTSSLGRI
jgi:hypothetical protein